MPKNRAYKGTVWERRLAVQFSLWWSNGLRSDIFWRTGGSGGRARRRGRTGRQTENQHGDLFASDPSGIPLMRMMVIEAKKGYNRVTIHDILDKPTNGKEQKYEEWICKAQESKVQASSYHWMIIHKRDRREPLFIIPWRFYTLLPEFTSFSFISYFKSESKENVVIGSLDEFFKIVKPERIIKLLESWNGEV